MMSRNSRGHYSGDVTRCHCRVTVTGIVFRSGYCLQESPTVIRITNGLSNSSLYGYRAEAVDTSITIATHCNTQHLNYHCNTLQHTAPRLPELGSLSTRKMKFCETVLVVTFSFNTIIAFLDFSESPSLSFVVRGCDVAPSPSLPSSSSLMSL